MKISTAQKHAQNNKDFLRRMAESQASLAAGNKKNLRLNTDQITLSGEQKEQDTKLGYADFIRQQEEMWKQAQTEMETARKEMEASKQQTKAMKDMYKKFITCMKIASRIISGNKVPVKDVRYLMKNSPELYAKAIILRQEKDDPKEYKQLSEDEEDDGTGTTDTGSGSVTQTTASGEASGGESSGGEGSGE